MTKTLHDLVPDGHLFLAGAQVVLVTDEEGEQSFVVNFDGDLPMSSTVGLLEMVKHRLLTEGFPE